MSASGTMVHADGLAHDLFMVVTQLCVAMPRAHRRTGELKELEYLTLAALRDNGTMIVGDIQRMLGVLPAQMSRIIRSLEGRDHPLIACQINANDKRKIDVALTQEGFQKVHEHQSARIHGITEVVQRLTEEDREDLGRLLDVLRESFERSVAARAE